MIAQRMTTQIIDDQRSIVINLVCIGLQLIDRRICNFIYKSHQVLFTFLLKRCLLVHIIWLIRGLVVNNSWELQFIGGT